MSDTPLQFTLREIRAILTAPMSLIIMVVVAIILGVSGPFGTYELMQLGPRLAYWLAMTFATFLTGHAIGTLVSRIIDQRMPDWSRIGIIGVVAGLGVTGMVMLINFLTFPKMPTAFASVGVLAFYCVVITTGVTLALNIVTAHRTASSAQPGASTDAAILTRLPVSVRGPLVRMTTQDHYVEVETTRGKSLVLMRMADALKEAQTTPGLQIHRSHWVALDQIADVARTNGKVIVKTSSGVDLPVSRTYLPALRDAGLIR